MQAGFNIRSVSRSDKIPALPGQDERIRALRANNISNLAAVALIRQEIRRNAAASPLSGAGRLFERDARCWKGCRILLISLVRSKDAWERPELGTNLLLLHWLHPGDVATRIGMPGRPNFELQEVVNSHEN